jgi:hypothetical protein
MKNIPEELIMEHMLISLLMNADMELLNGPQLVEKENYLLFVKQIINQLVIWDVSLLYYMKN